ncbi:MAG: hypothetical protein E6G74_11805 [Alphaproteobacteria bacterium]|nr:MAG: hypothetical protein E6G77_18050 [Alphaproteobacteria bacterium]TMK00889.1 MAG: hypothetical protein E6G74_11805 [Alphaproteobacteria bacterium]
MFLLMSGIVVFLITAAVFWALLPRGGNRHRWVDTEWEPYISVALCSGVALAFTMTLSGVLNLMGTS